MKISYSLMGFDDVDGVHKISKEAFSLPWTKEAIQNEVFNINAQYIVAKNDFTNEILGFVGAWLIAGEASIINIAITKKFRHMGIGTGLINNLYKLCKDMNCNSITLEVRESNKIAQDFYKKMGFVEEGMRKNFYDEPKEDCIIMWNRSF